MFDKQARKCVWGLLLVALILMLQFATTACGGPQRPIIGKWMVIEDDRTISLGFFIWEFFEDGTVSATDGAGTWAGNYKFIDDNHIRVEFVGLWAAEVFEVRISGDRMNWTDATGAITRFRRIR